MFAQLHGCGSEPSARERRASANYDGQVVMLAEGLQMTGFEPAPLEIARWSDSHRRIRVYKTRPVAAEAQRQNGVHGRNRTCDLHLRTVAL
jgi:hypothetical protein